MLDAETDDFGWNTAADIAAAVAAGRRTAENVVAAALARIRARDPLLNAFTTVIEERAVARARTLDEARARRDALPPLAGVPFAVKNLFDVAGLTTFAGAKINRDAPAAKRDATIIRRLEAAGAILVGALNMGEYAYDFTGENMHYGASHNPHDLKRMTGGSSGGSAAAVAGGLVPLALGSDTNGSIRVPASLSGLFGLKPTFGRISRAGTFPFVASLDHVGPLARRARDLALAYDAMQGYDPDDPVCAERPAEPVVALLDRGVEDLRIAVAGGYFKGRNAEVVSAVDRVAAALGANRDIEIPQAERARAAAFVITSSEGGSLHLSRLRTRARDFDPAVRDRLIAGAMVPASLVMKAQKFRRWYRGEVLKLFAEVDAIVAPATPCTAPLIGQQTFMFGDTELPVRANLGIYTQPISFIGLPVVAVPVPLEPLPMGVQIIAAPWREDIVLRIAHALEMKGVVAAPRPQI
jgi:aspartyl-tRNA(Asn)/glutamyl-tRNA(Gln) amidotransferase subunit A